MKRGELHIYIFYADVFVLQNMCMDYIALAGVNCFLKRRKKLRVLILVSFLGSFISLFLQIGIKNAGVRTILLHFVVNTGMTCFAFGWTGKRAFLENWCFVYLTILFLGGIMEWEETIGFSTSFFWIKAILAAVTLSVVTVYFMQKKNFMERIYPVEILHKGKQIAIRGYWDSGNLLVDPYVKEPVNILQKEKAEKLFDRQTDYMRLVPYASLGNLDGLLEVYSVDAMYIWLGKKKLELKPAVVGIAKEDLFKGREYDMILQATVLERENGNAHEINST